MSTRLNIYFGVGRKGEELKQSFIEVIGALGYKDASEFCQSIARNEAGINALLQQEHNGVDLDSTKIGGIPLALAMGRDSRQAYSPGYCLRYNGNLDKMFPFAL